MSRGYDKFEKNQGLVLDILMTEGIGTEVQNWAKDTIDDIELTGAPTWSQMGNGRNLLNFDRTNPDFIQADGAESTELDFTVEDFSLSIWVNFDTFLGGMVMCRGLVNADGWYLYVDGASGRVYFATNQAAAVQRSFTFAGDVALDGWYHIVATRDGTDGNVYINGRNRTEFKEAHTNPVTSARKLLIGVDDTEAAEMINGRIWRPEAWVRALTSRDVKQIFETERHWFGV